MTRGLTRLLVYLALALALDGCADTISQNPIQDLPKGHLSGAVIQGLIDATWNLDQAVAIGALPATDPAPPCFHGVLLQLGVDPANLPTPGATSFTPKESDLISLGSVLYIRTKQLQAMRGSGIEVPTDCKLLISQFLLDAAASGTKAFPGAGLLPVFK